MSCRLVKTGVGKTTSDLHGSGFARSPEILTRVSRLGVSPALAWSRVTLGPRPPTNCRAIPHSKLVISIITGAGRALPLDMGAFEASFINIGFDAANAEIARLKLQLAAMAGHGSAPMATPAASTAAPRLRKFRRLHGNQASSLFLDTWMCPRRQNIFADSHHKARLTRTRGNLS